MGCQSSAQEHVLVPNDPAHKSAAEVTAYSKRVEFNGRGERGQAWSTPRTNQRAPEGRVWSSRMTLGVLTLRTGKQAGNGKDKES